MIQTLFNKKLFIYAAFLWIGAGVFNGAGAATIEDLQKIIEEKNAAIEQLEQEAKKYREEIALKKEQGATLASELKRIDRNIALVRRDISITEQKIKRTEFEIEALKIEIGEKERSLATLRKGLGDLIVSFFENEQESPLAVLIKYAAFSTFFQLLDYGAMAKEKILASVATLRTLNEALKIQKAAAEEKKHELEDLENLLEGRQKVLSEERNERTYLLKETKNEEKRYRDLLRAQEEKRERLEEEIRKIEDEIRITIDPHSLPQKRPGVLDAPLPDISLVSCWQKGIEATKNCVTQFFGSTDFARLGAYKGKGHNGVDFRAEVGTPVMSAGPGVVIGVGDTDTGCRGASYGKWILIEHPNNLATLYAHLSHVSVVKGQEVFSRERIGFSGKSGYATGPHLHFTVFARQAVRIESIRSVVCGRLMTLPIAATNGYLNPLDYL